MARVRPGRHSSIYRSVDRMPSTREVGSVWDNYALRIWSAKQTRTKATFRLWYIKHVLWGEPELRLVAALCDANRLTLDVGANRGMYSLAAARFSKGVIAFEPQPHFVLFMRTFLPKRVRIIECAVSDSGGVSTLLVPSDPRYHAEARLANGARAAFGTDRPFETKRVRTLSLDEAVNDPVGLIKIDVEGHELAVLRGATRIINSSRPSVIIELEDRHNPGTVDRACEWFSSRDYRGFCIKRGSLVDLNRSICKNDAGEDGYIYNFVFLPAERAHLPKPAIWPALSGALAM